MTIETNKSTSADATWRPIHVYIMAAICLLIGTTVGYLARGSATHAVPAGQASPPTSATSQSTPSMEDMKRMADKQAEPLLGKLRSDPKNSELLNEIGTVYRLTHQFQTAESYYQKVLELNPENVGARTDMASCMFYRGDADGAIGQLERVLTYDPKHAGALLNLGLIRWQAKSDAQGAIEAWTTLLKDNPAFPRKAEVDKLIAQAKAHT